MRAFDPQPTQKRLPTRTGAGGTLAASLLLCAATPALAALNDTGITTCSDAARHELPCPVSSFPGQDAEYGRDAEAALGTLVKTGGGKAGFDFTKLDASGTALPADAKTWDCVRDNVTGLVWEHKTTDGGLRDAGWEYYWYDSSVPGALPPPDYDELCFTPGHCNTEDYVHDVNATGLCGFRDWRMPDIKELMGLQDFNNNYDPALNLDIGLDPAYFSDGMGGSWSGTIYAAYDPEYPHLLAAWDTSFLWRGTFAHNAGFAPVRLVRGQSARDAFVDHGNGTVTQTNTGLMWAQCGEGQIGRQCETGSPALLTWRDALAAARDSRLGGYDDWRLPSIKELQALVDYSRISPAINVQYFPNATNENSLYWSGSPSNTGRNDDPYHLPEPAVWFVDFAEGSASIATNFEGERDTVQRVRLVRNAVGVPDFVLTSVKPGKMANGKVDLSITVKNQGTEPGDGGKLAIWANQATAPTCGTPGDLSVDIGTLAVGASRTLTLNGMTLGGASTNTFRAFVDSNCVTDELNEDNNQLQKTYKIRSRGAGETLLLED